MFVSPICYFLLSSLILTAVYLKVFKGIQGDAFYYYSYAVSILWDGDLDLRNQFDHPLPGFSEQTVTGGNYFIDAKTGRAFSLFNIGTGLLMLPALGLAKGWEKFKGERLSDPFSPFYQRWACFTTVIVSAFSLLVLFMILKNYFSFAVAALGPLLFLLGTNWLFYATYFAGWAHAYSVAFLIFVLGSFLEFKKRRNYFWAALFGLSAGLLFSIRNFNLIPIALLFILAFIPDKADSYPFTKIKGFLGKKIFSFLNLSWLPKRRLPGHRIGSFNVEKMEESPGSFPWKRELTLSLCFLFSFWLSSFPQFYFFYITHGSPFISSFKATTDAIKPFFAPEAEHFQVIYLKNLFMLPMTILNSENGLFYFHPLYLFGLVGFILYRHPNRRFHFMNWALFLAAYCYWFLDAAYFDTWFCRAAGAGFGHRRFLDILPFFIFGAAYLLEKVRQSKIGLLFVSALVSLLTTSGLSFFIVFIRKYADFYRQKDNFFKFYAFLLKGWEEIGLFLLLWATLIFLLCQPKEKTENKIIAEFQSVRAEPKQMAFQAPPVMVLIVALLVIPVLVFRRDAEWDRQRFRERQGFFLFYSPTPLVKLYGNNWSLPEDMGRRLLTPEAKIILPAGIRKGDGLLWKISGPPPIGTSQLELEIYAHGRLIGRQEIKSGRRVYSFMIEKEIPDSCRLSLRIVNFEKGEVIIFHEGKIIFQEGKKPPFGNIDLPPEKEVEAGDEVGLEGWALDDWGVVAVEIRGQLLSTPAEKGKKEDRKNEGSFFLMDEEKKLDLGQAEFIEGNRPDVERVFVLYPDILRSGWKAVVRREALPEKDRSRPLLVEVWARDKEGHQTLLGERLIYWKN